MDWEIKRNSYEQQARSKQAQAKQRNLRLACTICGEKSKLLCPCGTTQYCTVACQKIDWRERGHRTACKQIRDDRTAEAARAEAPPSPPEVFYGPAPRTGADEVRSRIAAEHEAARVLREENPEPEPMSARIGSRCPICMENWNPNESKHVLACCCKLVCASCVKKVGQGACALCRAPCVQNDKQHVDLIRRHAENEVPEAIFHLGQLVCYGEKGLKKSDKKAAKLWTRAVALGDVRSATNLGQSYLNGCGVKLNRKKAMQLFRMAADKGSAMAAQSVGKMIVDGPPDQIDHVEAFRWFKLAADRGLHYGFHSVAQGYTYGHGVEQDLDEAKRWYLRLVDTELKEEAMAGLALLRGDDGPLRALAARIAAMRRRL